MSKKILYALLLALVLALSVTPAFAQGSNRGDQFCAGGNTTVESGEQTQNLLLFGCNGNVKNGGTVNGDVAVFGGNLTLESGSRVTGDVALFGGNVSVAGEVMGDVAIMGGSLHLNSSAVVDGNVRVVGGSFSRDDGSTVRGSISHENNFTVPSSLGRIFVSPNGFQGWTGLNSLNGFGAFGLGLFRGMITALALAALGALLVVFFPGATRRVMQTAQTSVGPSFGVGCLTLLLAPIVFLLLLITLIGPVILVLALAAAWIFGWIAIGYLAGERILEALKVREVAPVLAVVVGVLLLAILGEVPCLGWLISLIVGTIGVGAVILTRFGTRPYPYTPMGGVPVPVGPMPPGPMSPAVARPEPPAPVQPGGPELTPSTGSEGKLGPGEPQG